MPHDTTSDQDVPSAGSGLNEAGATSAERPDRAAASAPRGPDAHIDGTPDWSSSPRTQVRQLELDTAPEPDGDPADDESTVAVPDLAGGVTSTSIHDAGRRQDDAAPVDAGADASSARPARAAGPHKQSPRSQDAGRADRAGSQRRKSTRDPQPPKNDKRPRAQTSRPKVTPGDELEYRLARMCFWQGSYTRYGIDLQRHFHPEPLLVTDLDLLAVDLTSQLGMVKTIGEAKSGTSKNAPKPLDRAIWLAGVMKLVGADRSIMLSAMRPSERVRETARSLGVQAMSVRELDRWESTWLDAEVADVGSHGPTAFQEIELTRQRCKDDQDLERVFWFLRVEVWFLDPWQATKRTIGAIATLGPRWTPRLDDDAAAALRWLYAEALSVLTLNLVALIGRYRVSELEQWPSTVKDRLAEGAVPAPQMRALSARVDDYVGTALAQAGAPHHLIVESLGAFVPTPPPWADQLIELIDRLATSSRLSDLPRHVDLLIHERLVRRRHVSTRALDRVAPDLDGSAGQARRVIAAFLRGSVDLPEAVSKALTS